MSTAEVNPFKVDFLRPSDEDMEAIHELMAKDPFLQENKSAAEILHEMAATYAARNKVYGDNYKRVGLVMETLFPQGVALKTAEDFNRWHLFELLIVKITRFTNSGLTHVDSIHDACVYGAMVESLTSAESTVIGGAQ